MQSTHTMILKSANIPFIAVARDASSGSIQSPSQRNLFLNGTARHSPLTGTLMALLSLLATVNVFRKQRPRARYF